MPEKIDVDMTIRSTRHHPEQRITCWEVTVSTRGHQDRGRGEVVRDSNSFQDRRRTQTENGRRGERHCAHGSSCAPDILRESSYRNSSSSRFQSSSNNSENISLQSPWKWSSRGGHTSTNEHSTSSSGHTASSSHLGTSTGGHGASFSSQGTSFSSYGTSFSSLGTSFSSYSGCECGRGCEIGRECLPLPCHGSAGRVKNEVARFRGMNYGDILKITVQEEMEKLNMRSDQLPMNLSKRSQ